MGQAATELEDSLACQSAAFTPMVASRYHRAQALHLSMPWMLDRGLCLDPGVGVSFEAARRASPELELPSELVPKGHGLRGGFDMIDPAKPTPSQTALPPRQGELYFDGRPTRERPTELPTLFQLIDESGRAAQTHYLLPGQPIPSYPELTQAHRLRRPTLKASAGLLAAGAALAIGAAATERQFQMAERSQDNVGELEGLVRTTRGLAIGAGAATALGLGAGVGILWTTRR